jgi:hypothetical protein
MTTGTIPSLSEEGWVKSSPDVLAYNLAHYILSDAAQSITFQGNIINLPETYYLNINNPVGMASAIKTDLERLLGRYFVSVDVTTDVKEIAPKNYAILIYAAVIDDENIKHELTRVTDTGVGGVRRILEMNNYGDGIGYLNALP